MILTAVVALVFSFPGGGEVEYVNEIAKTFDENVVYFGHGDRSWPKSTLKDNRESNLRKRVLSSFGMRGSNNSEWAIANKSWPFHFVHKQNVDRYHSRFASSSRFPVTNSERVTLGECGYELVESGFPNPPQRVERGYRLSELRPLKLDKPVEWHWFFSDAAFLINVKNCPKEQLWKMVAKSMGGKWVEEKERYFIDLDLKEFRERWHAFTEPEIKKLSKMFQLRVRMTALSYDLLTDAELKELLRSPTGSVRKEVKRNTPLATEIARIIEDRRQNGVPMLQQFLESELTPESLIRVAIHSYKTSDVVVSSRDGKSRHVF